METKRRRLMNTFAAEDLHSESIQLRALRRPPRAANNLWAPSTKIYRRAAADTMTSTQGSNPATNRLIYSYPSFIHSIHPSIHPINSSMHACIPMHVSEWIYTTILTYSRLQVISFVRPSIAIYPSNFTASAPFINSSPPSFSPVSINHRVYPPASVTTAIRHTLLAYTSECPCTCKRMNACAYRPMCTLIYSSNASMHIYTCKSIICIIICMYNIYIYIIGLHAYMESYIHGPTM